jgi:uncharacterized protein YdeI (YjbR/CyaY-like superfamily)
MSKNNPSVDTYFVDGCGRCSLYRTPQCKVHTWTEELQLLRGLVLECGLKEELKWSQPCYTLDNKNILLVTAFKEYATIAFFKGALLKDPEKILVAPGENSQAVRQLRFNRVEDIIKMELVITAYINEAIKLEQEGSKLSFKKNPEPIPEELQSKLDHDPTFKAAFEALTPGRQRGYIIHFSQPKQSKTREARIEKSIPKILNGIGFNDR